MINNVPKWVESKRVGARGQTCVSSVEIMTSTTRRALKHVTPRRLLLTGRCAKVAMKSALADVKEG